MTLRLFFVHLLLGLPGPQGIQPSEQVLAACADVCDILSRGFAASPDRSIVVVVDERTGRKGDGCSVRLLTTTTSFQTDGSPDEQLRTTLPTMGWTEDFDYAADGPDGTAFALRRDAVLCQVRAMWDGGDDTDPAYVPDPRYELVAGCLEDPPRSTSRSPPTLAGAVRAER